MRGLVPSLFLLLLVLIVVTVAALSGPYLGDPIPAATTSSSTTTTTEPAIVEAATVTAPAHRTGNAAQVTDTLPPPPTTLPPPVDHDCASWAPWFTRYGMPWDRFERIARRESDCSHAIADRPSTRDLSAGVVQVNFYGNLNAMWEDAGWSWPMVRDNPEAAVAAAGALYRMCGGLGPWTPPYSCGGNVLPTPAEMGYGS